MSNSDKTEKYFDKAVEEAAKTRDYSQQRIDYIVILVATLGIFQITQLLSQFQTNFCTCVNLLFIPLFLFSISIIFNLISQYISLIVHRKAFKIFKNEAFKIRYYWDEYNPDEFSEKQKPLNKYNTPIVFLQLAAVISICLAIILSFLIYYYLV